MNLKKWLTEVGSLEKSLVGKVVFSFQAFHVLQANDVLPKHIKTLFRMFSSFHKIWYYRELLCSKKSTLLLQKLRQRLQHVNLELFWGKFSDDWEWSDWNLELLKNILLEKIKNFCPDFCILHANDMFFIS